MPIQLETIKKDGFDFWVDIDSKEYLILSNYYFDEALEYAKEKGIKNLELAWQNDLNIEDLDFLHQYDFFESVNISFDRPINIEGIYSLKKLNSIALADEINNCIDLSQFPQLENCWMFWSKQQNIDKCFGLKKMVVHKFGEFDLQSFSNLIELVDLEIVNTRKLYSLNGLNKVHGLKTLRLFVLPKLNDFNALKELSLIDYLHIESCKKLNTLSFIEKHISLKVLNINECGEIDSLKYLVDLDEVQAIWIRNTKVLDGDLTPLVGRKDVYCTNSKNHSHTWQQLQELQKR